MRAAQLAIAFLLVLLSGSGDAVIGEGYTPRHNPQPVQAVVDQFRAELGLSHDVTVSVVSVNQLLVSVESVEGSEAFLLSLEDKFLDGLDPDELKAVVAHELGHVWIFTHHPYLQTERLANQIAMRLVTRESLVKVYSKVWEWLGTKGDLVRFLGD